MKPSIIVIAAALAAVPAGAWAQGKKATNADAQRVVKLISADKAKVKAYCDLMKLGREFEEVAKTKDTKKNEELSQKAEALNKQVGPEYNALMDSLQDVDEKSPEGEAIGKTLDELDKLCEK